MKKINLGINIDHVATLRNARGENDPSLLEMAFLAQKGGADSITVHLREDRRHIKDSDLIELKKHLKIPINLEMALTEEMLENAITLKPKSVCIVPENREEVTTEGGLDAIKFESKIKDFTLKLQKKNIEVYLFIEPEKEAILVAKRCATNGVELHTGVYAKSFFDAINFAREVERLKFAASLLAENNLEFHAGHGLNYFNLSAILELKTLTEVNIGHAVIARSLSVGLVKAVRSLQQVLER